jgi:two-component system cell cycle response regulator
MHGRILIVDAAATNRVIHKVKLAKAFYEPILASDGAACLSLAQSEKPDLILLDFALPDLPGGEVLARLRNDPATRAIPVIVVVATADPAARMAALRSGADEVMTKPLNESVLLARLRNLMRSRADARIMSEVWGDSAPGVLGLAEPAATFEVAGSIGLIAARAETALAWQRQLERGMRDRLIVMTREQAMALPPDRGEETPDVFVIQSDLDGPDSGLRLMSALKSHAGARRSAFCIVAARENGGSAAMAFDLGADDVIAFSADRDEMELRLRTLLRRKRQTDRTRATLEDGLRLAMVDPLTGAYNRRYAMPRLAGIAAQAASENLPFAVMVVDLDRFKAVNDRHGHAAGDAVLVEVARRLGENLRISDLLARIGGEEFLVVLPQTGLREAERVAERLRQVISDMPVTLPDGERLSVTVSIGVAVGCVDVMKAEEAAQVVERADQALLLSKTGGRNLVTFSKSAA